MGPQWDTWMAVREYLSNAIDEGDEHVIAAAESIEGKEDTTRFYIEHHPDIVKVIEYWDEYFSFDRIDALVCTQECKIFPNICKDKNRILYRKGIQALKEGVSLFHYDLPNYTINESRVISSSWDANYQTVKAVTKYANKEVAKAILKGFKENEPYMESALEYDSYGSTLSNAWKEAIGNKCIINMDVAGFYLDMVATPHYQVSSQLCKRIKRDFPEIPVYGVGENSDDACFRKVEELSPRISYQLKKAKEALEELQIAINYPIEVVKFIRPTTRGLAENKTIYISEKCFEEGIRQTVQVIMEENEHLITGYSDMTREFQTHFLNKWLTSLEEQKGLFL